LLRRGERLGVFGGIGNGKTKFVRTIVVEHAALGGEVRWGTVVNIGYYDQRLQIVDDRNTAIDEIRELASSAVTDGELRGFLGRFLFSGDDVFKSVAALSGGEKGRLALAKLIYSRANVLVLDEPTNHLDIASREALEDALNEFDGTIITVSHDRYFLDRIATQILFFSGKGVDHFDGAYTEFYETHHRAITEREAEPKREQSPQRTRQQTSSRKTGVNRKKGKVKGSSPEEIEVEIQAVETEMKELTELLSTEEAARDWERLHSLNERYVRLDEQLRDLLKRWEAAHEGEANSRST
jgi:ATP-binding cassette subfamily F protein 3